MSSKKAFSKVYKVIYNVIFLIAKIACKFKTMGGFSGFYIVLCFYVKISRSVWIIFALCAIADNKNLHKFKQGISTKKALSAIAIDLLKGFV